MLVKPLLHITKATHHFKVAKFTPRVLQLCYDYARTYMKVDTQRSRQTGAPPTTTIFAAATKDRTEFRFHINCYDEFIDHLRLNGVTVENIEIYVKPVAFTSSVELKLQPKWEFRPKQLPYRDYLYKPTPRSKFVGAQPGFGKEQPLDAKIKIAGGWSTMGKMKVGTPIIAHDGTVTKVTGVFPNGLKSIYRVSFSDGRSTEAGLEHQWKIYIDGQPQVVNTNWIIKQLRNEPYKKIFIDLIEPEYGNDHVSLINSRSIGLHHHSSIALEQPFMQGSRPQRELLLEGLLRKLATKKGDAYICEVYSGELAQQLIELTRSLGGIARIVRSDFLSIVLEIKPKTPGLQLRLTDIRYVGEKQAQCIQIDHPDALYVTDDYIVTHNTLLSTAAICNFGGRTVVIVRPMYMKKWVQDLQNNAILSSDEICSIQGGKELKAYLALAEAKQTDDIKVVVLSNKTWQLWLKQYEEFGQELQFLGYNTMPEDFFEAVDARNRLMDEVHLDFHLNFKTDLYTHVENSVGLSGTLTSLDPFNERMYRTAYPMAERCEEGELHRFTTAIGVVYRMQSHRRYNVTEYGSTSYSHTAFEKSIMRQQEFLDSYVNMIYTVCDDGYIRNYRPGDRLTVFAASRDMCTILVTFLQRKWPHLTVRRFVEGDPYEENYKTPDVRVTTVLSGGTAHDVANLSTVVMTIAMQSVASNIQVMGRLRPLENRSPMFYFINCQDIPKQMKYYHDKVSMLEERALAFRSLNYHQAL